MVDGRLERLLETGSTVNPKDIARMITEDPDMTEDIDDLTILGWFKEYLENSPIIAKAFEHGRFGKFIRYDFENFGPVQSKPWVRLNITTSAHSGAVIVHNGKLELFNYFMPKTRIVDLADPNAFERATEIIVELLFAGPARRAFQTEEMNRPDPENTIRLVEEDPNAKSIEEIASEVRLKASQLGIDLPPTSVMWTDKDTSHYDFKDIYISQRDADDAFAIVAHEYGHVLYDMLSKEQQDMWFELVNKEVFNGKLYPAHGDEVFARSFQHVIANESEPAYEAARDAFFKIMSYES